MTHVKTVRTVVASRPIVRHSEHEPPQQPHEVHPRSRRGRVLRPGLGRTIQQVGGHTYISFLIN